MSDEDSDDKKSGGFSNSLKTWIGIGSAGVGLAIGVVNLGKLTGNEKSEGKAPAPIVVVTGGGVASSNVVVVNPSATAPTAAESAAPASEQQVIVVNAPAAPSAPPKEPRVINNELTIPKFESTEQVEYMESSGHGKAQERQLAIFNALEEAVSKQGAVISADIRLKMESETKRFNDTKNRRVEQKISSDFTRATDGLVRWWDIKTETEETDGSYTLEVAAIVAKIKIVSAAHATRKTIAVLPFKVAEEVHFKERTVAGGVIGAQFHESVLTHLVNSRKFAVLDKTFSDELDRLAGAQPGGDPIQRALEAAKKLGAQYAVVGLVDGLGVGAKKIGSLQVTKLDGVVSLRIIEVSSRQVVLASSFTVSDLPNLDLGGNRPENSIAEALGTAMSERTLEAIYPFKVAALNGPEEVILNRGGDDVSVGQQFELCNPGEEVKDPSTGESLGVSERKVAMVEVIRVTPKTSYAKVLSKTADIMVEAVCRKPQESKSQEKEREKPRNIGKEINSLFK